MESVDENLNATVRRFLIAGFAWGALAMLVGLWAGVGVAFPGLSLGSPWLTFGRLRPVHFDLICYAAFVNIICGASYHFLTRSCRAPLPQLSSTLHLCAWQGIVLAIVLLGHRPSVDGAAAGVWLALFGGNVLSILRRQRVGAPAWFILACVVGFGAVLVAKSAVGATGVDDALLQWWTGNGVTSYLLVMGMMGVGYWVLSAVTGRPVASWRLAVVSFWTLLLVGAWGGPNQVQGYAGLTWAGVFGSIGAWMACVAILGAAANGMGMLRGQWERVAGEPVLKFVVVAWVFLAAWAIEGAVLAIPSVGMVAQFTDWPVARSHVLGMGWGGLLVFGLVYWVWPRVCGRKLWSVRLADAHFWIAVVGVLLSVVPVYVAGATQGVMWQAVNANGTLTYDFGESTRVLTPMYLVRAAGGLCYGAGALLGVFNLLQTWWRGERAGSEELDVAEAQEIVRHSQLGVVADMARKIDRFASLAWHRGWEASAAKLVAAIAAVVVVPAMGIVWPAARSSTDVATRYTPLEQIGREIYVREGCVTCHTQVVRPTLAETKRYGAFTRPGEIAGERPALWGWRRVGPDLARESGRQTNQWHWRHLLDPTREVPGSLMPAYAWLGERKIALADEQGGAVARAIVDPEVNKATVDREDVVEEKAKPYEQTEAVALIAYLQRLGREGGAK